jgi:catechol 2,3-dioxygenase
MALPPETRLGAVRLTVADLDRTREFYERTVGLRPLGDPDDAVRLGGESGPVVELVGRTDAPPRPRGTTGLFHLAILLPDRAELARALRRVAETGWRLSGASDHLVSEALYLNDPEENGIEIYRDRPREQWRRVDGKLQMATLPLDLDSVLAELGDPEARVDGASPHARLGHVHVQVADLGAAEAFYAGTLGFEVTVREYPGALFVSAGGYHHHVGVNTWAGEGAPPPPPGSRGLRWFEVAVPATAELERLTRRLRDAGHEADPADDGILTADPSGNRVLLRAAR